jgi:hypothetical protein
MKRLVLLWIYFGVSNVLCQTQISSLNMENFAEEILSNQSEEDQEDLLENLLQILSQPIDLNTCTREDLASLLILSPLQIQSFFDYRNENGQLINLYELQAIPDFDLEIIRKLLPFVRLYTNESNRYGSFLKRIRQEKDAYLIMRYSRTLEQRRGFTPTDTLKNGNLTSRYLGDPNQIFGRFRVQHARDYSLGFTIEKDPGEQFIWDPVTKRYGFNFFSYHLTLYQKGRWKTLTFGDFRAQFGQGLVMGGGFGIGKGAETITTVRRSSTGLNPYTSAMESGFFRGVGGTYLLRNWELTFLLSNAPRDGNVEPSIENQQSGVIRSFQTSGLHRTPTEISYKNTIRELNLGFNAQYRSSKLLAGYTALITSFDKPYVRNSLVYNQFEFSGQENQVHGLYFNYLIGNVYAFGEWAVSSIGGIGRIFGMMGSLDKKLDFAMLSRNFDKNFHSFYGSSFGESSRPINEKGLYMGINYRFNPRWNWSMYYDVFEFPWLKFRLYSPSNGDEWMSRLTYKPMRNIKLFVQYREERKLRNLPSSDPGINYLVSEGLKRNFLFHIEGLVRKPWSFRTRIQGSSYQFNQKLTKGFAMSQDVHADFNQWRFSTRIALFDTEDFDNRQFFFERNVLWAFSMPALHGQGMRHYFLTQYKMNNKLTFWLRWAQTIYTDREIISSGLQQINSNRQTDIVFQLRYQMNR